MHLNIEELAKESMVLDIEDKALSVEVERLWLDETDRRLEDFRAGRVHGIPADEVFRQAIAELS